MMVQLPENAPNWIYVLMLVLTFSSPMLVIYFNGRNKNSIEKVKAETSQQIGEAKAIVSEAEARTATAVALSTTLTKLADANSEKDRIAAEERVRHETLQREQVAAQLELVKALHGNTEAMKSNQTLIADWDVRFGQYAKRQEDVTAKITTSATDLGERLDKTHETLKNAAAQMEKLPDDIAAKIAPILAMIETLNNKADGAAEAAAAAIRNVIQGEVLEIKESLAKLLSREAA